MQDQAILDRIEAMGESELDALPVGVITLGLDATVKRYNKMEAELARLDQKSQIGKHFFKEVAPCTANPEFQGRFEELAATPAGGVKTFDYTFKFSWGAQRVHITFIRKPNRDDVDVLVTRLGA
ncbi:MAG TPA: PAS domain-containing protein [Candidatus Aquilonibacter sp.]|nr:PAS domain-containing protein [Candidatus Aquilonibacter sp.]